MVGNDAWELLTVTLGMMDDLSRRVVEKRTKDHTLRNKSLKIRLKRRIQGRRMGSRRGGCHGNQVKSGFLSISEK